MDPAPDLQLCPSAELEAALSIGGRRQRGGRKQWSDPCAFCMDVKKPVRTLRKGHATLIRRPHIGREILSFVLNLMRRTLGEFAMKSLSKLLRGSCAIVTSGALVFSTLPTLAQGMAPNQPPPGAQLPPPGAQLPPPEGQPGQP